MKGFWGISELIVNTRLPGLSTSQGERSSGHMVVEGEEGGGGGQNLCV